MLPRHLLSRIPIKVQPIPLLDLRDRLAQITAHGIRPTAQDLNIASALVGALHERRHDGRHSRVMTAQQLNGKAILVDSEKLLQRGAVGSLGRAGGDLRRRSFFRIAVLHELLAGPVAAEGDVRLVLAGDEDADAEAGVLLEHLLELDEFLVEPEEVLGAADDPDEVDGGLGDDHLAEGGDDDGHGEGHAGAAGDGEDVVGGVLGVTGSVGSGDDNGYVGLTGESGELGGLAFTGAEEVGVMLDLAREVGHGSNGERVRLPDAETGEAQVEMLTRLPGFLFEIKVHSNNDIVTLANDLDFRHCATESNTLGATKVQVASPDETSSLVEEHQDETGDHPAVKFIPVTPASTDVENCSNPMGNLEEFISSPSNDRLQTEDEQEADDSRSDDSENGVHVGEEDPVDRCWLVEVRLDDGPADRVQHGLGKDDAAKPSV